MKTTFHKPSIADLKITLFFFDHSSGKIYRQNDNRDIVNLETIFHGKSPQPSAHENNIFWWKTKQKWVKNKTLAAGVRVSFCFEYTKKKNREKPILAQNVDKSSRWCSKSLNLALLREIFCDKTTSCYFLDVIKTLLAKASQALQKKLPASVSFHFNKQCKLDQNSKQKKIEQSCFFFP